MRHIDPIPLKIAHKLPHGNERRLTGRTPTALNTTLHMESSEAQEGIITDISFTGLFITTEYIEPELMAKGHHVTIELLFDYDATKKHYSETVCIGRSAENGIAVLFENYNCSHFTILQHLLHEAHTRKQRLKFKNHPKDTSFIYSAISH